MKNYLYGFIVFVLTSCFSTHKIETNIRNTGNILERKIETNKNDTAVTIVGELIDCTTQIGISYALIRLQLNDSKKKVAINTDYYGKFLLKDIAPGVYSLEFELVGYFPFLLQNLKVSKGEVIFYKIELKEDPRPM